MRIPSPAMRMRDYPHQMSGGMRQRIVGAIALAGGPRLIIADEPTTNLDVTIQAQYLDLLKDIQQETGRGDHLRHAQSRHRRQDVRPLAVMYAGKIVESGPVRDLFNAPRHPYTKALLGSMPKLGQQGAALCHPGPAARPGQPAAGLRLSSALRRGDAALRHAGARGCPNAAPDWTARCWLPQRRGRGDA